MSEPKVVLEFKNYAENGTMPFERRSMLISVCDHLARLAARVQELESLEYRECRNAALEEAEQACHDCDCDCAAAIRALKEKP